MPADSASFASLLLLGLVFSLLGLAWLTAYSVFIARVGEILRRRHVRRALDAVTGTVLVAFGLRLVTAKR